MAKPKVGMVGLAVMGSNLARNIESRGIPTAVYNRSYDVTEKFMQEQAGKQFTASRTMEEFVQSMESPRQIFIMVKAGPGTDAVIDGLIPLLAKGDIIIDGGNAYYPDTIRREKKCKEAGIGFLGLGVSGGEEGALNGPSLMPGGPKESWKIVAPLLEKIAAVVDGEPCTAYIGPDGSGHFVKMVHNGIEYGDMQLIAEAYHMLREVIGCKPPELSEIFNSWNQGVLSSFLIEITAKVFKRKDDDGSSYLVDKVLDKAGQKGTGKWTAQVALDLGTAIPALSSAVDARILSSVKDERVKASAILKGPKLQDYTGDRKEFISIVHDALYCSKIMSYAQGMALLAAASKEWNWDLQLGDIASLWRGGCIIRATFLNEIRRAFKENKHLANLMLDPAMQTELNKRMDNLRKAIVIASQKGIPVIAFSASLAYYDSYRLANLPQNLTQAQRDFFGAHTYERTDKPGVFHTEWEA